MNVSFEDFLRACLRGKIFAGKVSVENGLNNDRLRCLKYCYRMSTQCPSDGVVFIPVSLVDTQTIPHNHHITVSLVQHLPTDKWASVWIE